MPSNLVEDRSRTFGLPPGTLPDAGTNGDGVRISIIDYSKSSFTEKTSATVEECIPFKDKPTITWINVDGIRQLDVIERLGTQFGLHPLTLEDIAITVQRPKIDDLDEYIFIILKMISYDEKEKCPVLEQLSMVVGGNFVITFQEVEGDVFDPIRDRIRQSKGRIREMGSDYLAYSLIDMIVDHYFAVLERLGNRIERMEDEVMQNPNSATLQEIHIIKRQLIVMRRCVWPLRDVLAHLSRGDSPKIRKTTLPYVRDAYEHTIQVMDSIESFRELVSGLLETYLSTVSNRMNEIMKVLTIISTIFIPLTFVAGVYGMNFEHMPELSSRWGYPAVWAVMIAVSITLLVFFRKRKWI